MIAPGAAAPVARLSKIAVRDFRGFPGSETCEIDLTPEGKSLLIFGENGSGKSSLFQALMALLRDTVPPEPYEDHRNIFDSGSDGTITVELTSTPPRDFRWEHGEEHPAADETDTTFFEAARRASFLDYKALLKTSFMHEEADRVDLFDLIVNTLLRDVELPDGKSVYQHWRELLHFRPRVAPPQDDNEEVEDLESAEDQINRHAADFTGLLRGIINGRRFGVKARANRMLKQLDQRLRIQLRVGDIRLKRKSPRPQKNPHHFVGTTVRLQATYCGEKLIRPYFSTRPD